jgi:hypothetical protein
MVTSELRADSGDLLQLECVVCIQMEGPGCRAGCLYPSRFVAGNVGENFQRYKHFFFLSVWTDRLFLNVDFLSCVSGRSLESLTESTIY